MKSALSSYTFVFLALGAAASLSTLGCSRVKSARGPGGAHTLTCEKGMGSCVNEAAKICGDDGYTILGGVSTQKLLGGKSSSYRALAETAELSIHCGMPEPKDNEPETSYRLPPRRDEPLPAGNVTSACTPGATQKCVGAAACSGGQVCASDGRGFGPCDCGGSASAEPVSGEADMAESSDSPKAESQGLAGDNDTKRPEAGAPKVPGASPAPIPLN